MTLTLRIENFDSLNDGSPLRLTVDQRGASVGRGRSMDWVLPDPAKHISSHHFNITSADGRYWITDVSTNGTFIQGQSHRLEAPYCLNHGERLLVGPYIIGVQIEVQAIPPDPFGTYQPPPDWDAPAAQHEEIDPWEFGAVPARAPHAPQVPPIARYHPGGLDFIPLQQPGHHPGGPQSPGIQTPSFDTYSPANQHPNRPVYPQPVTPPPFYGEAPAAPPALQMPGIAGQSGPRPAAPIPPAAQAVPYENAPTPMAPAPPQSAPPQTAHSQTAHSHIPPAVAAASADHDAIVAAFCAGAGLDPSAAKGVSGDALAHLLGQVVRISTDEIMRMLHDRSNVKHFTKGGERTMRSATGNNPMKFLPDAEQAIEAMFLRPRDGFMTGPEGFKNALKDLNAHQLAVFAALQPALAAVLDGISPEEIEAAETTGNLLSGSRKGKSWDLFVKRWDAKANAGEHGMLDAFLLAFARAYAQANARSD